MRVEARVLVLVRAAERLGYLLDELRAAEEAWAAHSTADST